jgi:hypothetical protein
MQIWTKTILNPVTRHDWLAQCEPSGLARNVADSSEVRRSYRCRASLSTSIDLLIYRPLAGRPRGRRVGLPPTGNGILAINPASLYCVKCRGNPHKLGGSFVTNNCAERDSAETVHSNSRCFQSTVLEGRLGRQFPAADRQPMNSINQTISRFPNSLSRWDRGKQKTNQNEKRNANQRIAIRRDSNCDCGKFPVGGALRRAGQSG